MADKNKSEFQLEAWALFSSLKVSPDNQFIPLHLPQLID